MTILNTKNGELEIHVPKSYAKNVIASAHENVKDHIQSLIVHATSKDHIFLNNQEVSGGLLVLDNAGFVSAKNWNPILIGINLEYETIDDMLKLNTFVDGQSDIGKLVMVKDATADKTVLNGKWATYRYKGGPSNEFTSWEKIAENQSIDFVFGWDDLDALFKSTFAQIDKLGQEGHSHGDTINALNKLSEENMYLVWDRRIALRKRFDIHAYVSTDDINSPKIYPGDMVYHLTGSRENPLLDPNGNPKSSDEETYAHKVQNRQPDITTISGDCTGYFKDNTELINAPKIRTGNVSRMTEFFSGCTKLFTIPWYDTSGVYDMDAMCYNCKSLSSIPTFDMSKVRTANKMFSGCDSLVTIPSLVLYSLTKANEMFKDCTTINNIPDLNTPLLEEVGEMFSGCTNLENAPNVKLGKCKNLISMFDGCVNMKTCGSLDTNSATTMGSMFKNCHKLESIAELDMSKCEFTEDMFSGCESLIHVGFRDESLHTDISFANTKLDRITIVQIFNGLMSMGENKKSIDLTNTPGSSELTDSDIMIATDRGWNVIK